jgi:hypothetical protein
MMVASVPSKKEFHSAIDEEECFGDEKKTFLNDSNAGGFGGAGA